MRYLYTTYKALLVLVLSLLLGSTVLMAQEMNCMDGLDDDGDKLTDCFDPDCPSCDFDCEYKVPASGSGDITLMTANTGTDPDYIEVFVLIDSSGTIQYMTTTDPPTFPGVIPGQYLALVLVYQADAGIKDLAVGNDINIVSSGCFAMSDSYPFEVCINEPPVLTDVKPAPLCYCAGETIISETIMADDPDMDSIKATITISSGYVLGEDILTYNGTIPVPTMFDASTGTLMLGPAPPSVIDFALNNVAYQNTNALGSETAGTRSIDFTITDGYDTTGPISRDILVGDATCPCQEIMATKSVAGVDNMVCDGTGNMHVTYSFVIENTGGLDVGMISLDENLASQLGAAFVSVVSAPIITASTATTNPLVNGGYDGSSSPNLFDGTSGTLASGESITVEVTVALDNTQINSTLANQATASGTAIDDSGNPITDGIGNPVVTTDLTDDGTDPTTNNGSGGTDDTTPLLFPDIGVTKAVTSSTPTIGGNPEDYTVTYELIVQNTGTTILEDITLLDDLSAWGGALLTSPSPSVALMNIDASILPTDNNGTYDAVADANLLLATGSGLLNPGESFKVIVTVGVDKSQAPLSGLSNSAMTEGVPTDGAGNPIAGVDNPTDTSDDATGLAAGDPACKNPGAANDSGGADDATIVTFPPCPVLTKTIPSPPVELANGNYSVTYDFVIENSGGAEMCNIDLTEDFATQLGCAFQEVISTTPIVLTNTTGNSSTPTANVAYDGTTANSNLFNSDGCLFPGDEISLSVTVELDVSCAGVADPLLNTATVCGYDPDTGMKATDDSDSDPDGGGPDDPTPLEIPDIDVAKDQVSSTMLPNGNFEVEYQLVIQNTGNTDLTNVALEDDIATQFNPAFVSAMTVSITGTASTLGGLNTGFIGSGVTGSATADGDDILDRSAILQPGETIIVNIKVEIDPLLVPQDGLTNQAKATGTDPDGGMVMDESDDGTDPTDDTDEPTPLDLGPIPELEKTLTSAPLALPNGNFEMTYQFKLKNNGTEEMCQIDVLEDFDSQFGCAFVSASPASLVAFSNNTTNSTQPTFNTAYNGGSFTNMFNGDGCLFPTDSLEWSVTVEVTTDCDPLNSPLANIATVNAEDPDGNPVTDDSDDDTDLDDDDNPDNESGGEDDPTFAYVPNIEITKTLTNQTVLPDGNIELEFQMLVENTGNANLSSILVEDPLSFNSAIVGTPTVSLTNISASSPPADNNGSFDGSGDDDLTVASTGDLLQPNESFIIDMVVVVDPEIFGLLMPQPVENQATVSGTPVDDDGDPIPGYPPVEDDSDDGTDLEPGPDDPTPITIPPIPEVTKAIVGTPVELANGNYSVEYEFVIYNLGGSRFCQIDLLEDFATQYGCAFVDVLGTTPPVLANISGNSIIPTANSLYNGATQSNLLNTDGCLYPGDSIIVTTTIEVDPACSPVDDPLVNQATVQGVDDEGNPVEDDSDDESDFPNDTGGSDDPTLLSIPDIDLAKTIIDMTALPNGNMEVVFQMVVQNTGNTQLTNVAIEDDLATQFSPAFVSAMPVSINGTASTLGGLNTGFNGSGTTNSAGVDGDDILDRTAIMEPGEVIVVEIKVEIDPLQVPVTGLANQATATGDDPNGDPVTDDSDDGTDPTDDTDEPTPLDFGPIPELEKTLASLPVPLANGNYELTFEYNLKNNGTSEFCQIDVLDNFNTRFGCAFVSSSSPSLINFANNSGSSLQPSFNVAYNGNTFDNMFTGNGCIFPGDSIQWQVTVEVTLDCDPVASPLANIATVNAEDPDGDPVTDDSDDETDLDDDDDPDNETGGEDDPTLTYLPEIEITKELTGSTALPNGNVVLEFKFNIENTGNANLSNINVTDPLPFATAVVGTPVVTLMNTSATMPPTDNNGAYNGGSNINMTLGTAADLLRPNESFMVMLEVEVDPLIFGTLPMPLLNQATVTGDPVDDDGDPIPGYPPVEDDSDDDSDLPGDDDPTPVSIPPTPELLKSIVGTPTELANGNYSVVYNFTIKNLGGSEFCQIDLLEDFATQYGCAFVDILTTTPPVLTNLSGNSTNPSLNTLYDGASNVNLLNTDGCLFPGDSITLTATAEIDPTCMPVDEPLMNTATVNGEDPDGNPVTDDSDDESDTPNDTGGPDDPTLLSIPDIDVSKEQLGYTNLPNGNIEVDYQLVVQNTGNTQLTNVALEDDIATQFAPAFVSAMGVSISGSANTLGGLNAGFNGSGTAGLDGDDILDRTAIMNPGEQIIVTIKVEVDPLLVPTDGMTNQATATGDDPDGDPVSDDSDDGTDPTDDTDEPTPLDLGPIPEILKSVVSAPTQLANGNYTMDYSFILKNNGTSEMCNIDVLEDLDTQYGCAFVDADPASLVSFGNVSGNSIQPSINTGYNGNSDVNMFTGNGCLFPGDSLEWTITVEVTMDCEPIPSPLANTATVNAEDPDGNPVTDDSDDDTGLDDDDDPDNDSGDDDDPTFAYFPEIEITKDLVSVTELPNGNFEMEFKFNIENTGNANLSNIAVMDPLPFSTAVVGTPVVTLMNVSGTMPPADNNGAFNGGTDSNLTLGAATDLLQPNESFMITMTAEVDPTIFGTLPMPVENQATVTGDPVDDDGDPLPGYPPVEDDSDDDSDLPGDDDPTPVSIPPVPQLTKAISGTPTPLANGNYAVTYDFIIENIGGSEFCNIDLLEDFASQYDCAFVQVLGTTPPVLVNGSTNSTNPTLNTIYNGSTQTNLLNTDGCLFPSDSITVSVTIEVDISCPTRPEPLANQATVMGEGPNGEEVEDDSDDDSDLDDDDDPDNDTGGEDDPTLLPIPEINVTKAFTGGVALPNDEYELNYEFIVENTGNVDLSNLSLLDSLVFGSTLTATPMVSVINISATTPPAVNSSYDGISSIDLVNGMASNLLEPGQQYKVTLKAIVDIATFTDLPQPVINQATASGDDPDGNTVEDESDDESDNPNDTGGPDDPTIVSVPQIKITKDVVDIQPATTEGNYYVTFELIVKNTGNVDLDSIQVSDDLAAEFGTAYVGLTSGPISTSTNGTPTIPNAGSFPTNVYDGVSGSLAPQEEISIQFTVEVDPDAGGAPTPLQNQATATGQDPDGETVMDESDDSADPDDPDMDTPTPLPLPNVELEKTITEVAPAASGTPNHHDVTYQFVIENTGNVPMDSLSLVDDLATDFGAAFIQVVSLPTIDGSQTTATTPPTINPLFIGASPALDLLLGMPTDMLLPGEQLVIEVVVEVNPSAAGADSPLLNQATAGGNDPNDTRVEEESEASLDCKPAKLSISPEAITICEGEDVTLNANSDVAWTMYKWYNQNLSNTVSSTQQNPTFEDITVTTDFVVTLCPTDGMCWTGLTDTITINVIPEAARPQVEDIEVCEGDLLQLTTTTTANSYQWTGPNGFTSTDQNPFVTSGAGLTDAGPYELVVFQNECPSDTAILTVTIHAIPEAPTLRSNGPICEGEELVLSTSAVCDTFLWVGPLGSSETTLANPLLKTIENQTTIPATDTAYQDGLWSVICINGTDCASAPSEDLEVVIHPIPSRPTPNYSGAVCEGNSITLLAGGNYPIGTTYAWYNADPNIGPATIVSTNENPVMDDLAAGIHEYWLVVTTNKCNSEAIPVRVTIHEVPTATASNDGTECVTPMTDINLSSTATGGTGPYSFEWTGPNGFASTDQNPILPNASDDLSGSYTIVITDANGCTATASTVIDITVGPDVPFLTGTSPLCIGESFLLSAAPTYTGTDITYEWVGPLGSTTSGAYPNAATLSIDSVGMADAGSYTLQVTVDGCTSLVSQPFELITKEIPNEPIVEDVVICLGDLLQIGTETEASSYLWTGPNGFTSTDQRPFVSTNASPIDVGAYELVVIQDNCPSVSAIVNVTIHSTEDAPTLRTNSPICEGDDLVLSTSATCETYIWIGPDGNSATTLSNPLLMTSVNTTTIPPIDSAYDAGLWTLICQNGEGCESAASDPVEVTINEIPATPIITNNTPICFGEEVIIGASGDYPVGTIFNWYDSDPASGASVISNEQNPTFSNFTDPGDYVYWLTITINGCTSPAGQTLVVIRELPTVAAMNSGTECVDPMTDLTISALPAGGTAPYTYAWSGPNNFASIDSVATLPNAGNDLSGTYIVVITDANGCTATAETVIDVTSNPNRPNIVYSGVVCEGESATISIQEFSGTSVEYNWFKDGASIPNIGNQLVLNPISVADIGNYHVVVEIDGCSTTSDTLALPVYSQPTATIAMVDNQPCVNGSEEISLIALPQGGSGSYTYSWSGPNGFSSTDSIATLINIDATASGTYTLEVTDENGCVATIASETIDITDGISDPIISISDLACEGGEVKMSIPAYEGIDVTYTWTTPAGTNIIGFATNEIIINPISNALHAGDYFVKVEVDGCEIYSDTFNLKLLPAPTVNPTATEGTICSGGTLALFANAEGAAQFEWSGPDGFTANVADPLQYNVQDINNGTYGVTVTNTSGCTEFGVIEIDNILNENDKPTIISNSPICEGDSIMLITGTAGSDFEWIGPLGPLDTLEEGEKPTAQYIIDFDLDVPIITFITDQLADVQGNVLMNDGSGTDSGFDYTMQINVSGGPDGSSIIGFPTTDTLAASFIDQGTTNIGTSGGSTALLLSLEGRVGNAPTLYARDPSSKLNFSFSLDSGEKIKNFTYEIGDVDYSFESATVGNTCFDSGEINDYNCRYSFIDRITFLTDIANNEYTVGSAAEIYQVNDGQFYARFPDANDNQRPDFADNGGIASTDPSGNIRVCNPNATTSIDFIYDDPGYGIEGDADGYHDFDSGNALVSILSGMTFDIAKVKQGDTLVIAPDDPNYLSGEWRVKVTGANCCMSISDPIEMVINEIPATPLPQNSGPVCEGSEFMLWAGADYPEGTVFNWYEEEPTEDSEPISNKTNPKFTDVLDPGEYTYWLTITIDGCTSDAGATTVVINELPTVSAINSGTECVDPTADLSLSALPGSGIAPYTYVWSGPNGFTSIDSVVTLPNASDDLSGTYIITITDANGCTASAETVLDVSGNPNRPNLIYSGVACEGEEVRLMIQEFGGVSVNYSWFKDGIVLTNIGNQLTINPVSIDDIGAYYVQVEVDDCMTISDTLLVEVYEQPSATIAMVADQPCVEGSEELQLVALPTGGSGIYTYSWSGPNGFTSSDSMTTLININAATSGTYTLVVTDENGCIAATASQTVDITDGLVEPTINISNLSCEGGEVKMTIPAFSGNNVTYTWTTPTTTHITGLNTNEIIINPMDSTIHSGNYSVVVEVDGCTIQSDTFFLQTLPAPTVDPSATAEAICAGGTLNLFANATDAVQYTWAGPNNFVSSLSNPTISSVSVANNGPYAVTVTNSSGCTAVGLVTVDVILEGNQTASIVSNSPICEGEDIVLSTSTEGVRFEWIGPLGASEQTLNTFIGLTTTTGTTTISAGMMAYKEGTYQVRVTDANGCTSMSEEIEVVMNDIPATPLPSNASPVCLGNEVQLLAGAIYPDGTVYNWYDSDPALGGATIISNAANPTIDITSAGSYTYWLTVTLEGCTSSAGQTTITINELPTVLAVNSGMECVGSMTDLTVAAIPTGGIAPYTYRWSGPNGFASLDSAATLPNASSDLTGTYIVEITDANGCTATSETVIDVTGSPNRPNLIYSGSECEGERIELGIQAFEGTTVSYAWYKDGTLLNSTNNQLILNPARVSDNGNYWVEVRVDDCSTVSDTLALEVYEEPSVSIAVATERPCEQGLDELNLIALPQNGVAPYTYTWSGPNGFVSTDSVATIVNITSDATGIYTLFINDANGCSSVMATRDVDITDDFLEPQIDITNQACEGEEIVLEVPTYQGVEVRYDWTLPSTVNITGLNTNTLIINPVDTALHQGNYSVVITIDDCVVMSDTFNLETLGSPSVTPSIVSGTLCAGGILEFAANATNAATYEWSGPEGFTSDLPNPRINEVSILNNGQYGVTVTNSSGCAAVGYIEVNVIEEKLEIPSFVTNSPICEGEDLILSTSSLAERYEWIGPLGGSQQTLATYPELLTPEQSTIISSSSPAYLAGEWRVRIIDANGCSEISEPIEVIIHPIPRALAFNNGPICNDGSVQLEAEEIEGATYEWRILDDPTIISTDRMPTIQNLATTTQYELTVIAEGCISQLDTTVVEVWEAPLVIPSSTYDLNTDCAPSDLQLFANAVAGSGAIVEYRWTGPNNFTSTLPDPTIPNASEAVNGTYTLEVVDEHGCVAQGATEILNVTDEQNAPFITSSGPSCEGGIVELSIPAYSGATVTYDWVKDGDTLPNTNNAVLILNPVHLSDAGSYEVHISVDGCTIESASYELAIYAAPSISIAPIDSISCTDGFEDLTMDATVQGGQAPFTYAWSGPNGFASNLQDANLVNVSDNTSGTYSVTVTDVNGCTSETSITIDIKDGIPQPVIQTNGPVCEGNPLSILIGAYTGNNVSYNWTGPNGTSTANGDYPNASFINIVSADAANAGTYQVQVTVDGCSVSSNAIEVAVYDKIVAVPTHSGGACDSDLQLFANVNLGNTTGLVFEWTGPNGFVSNVANPIITNPTAINEGSYTVVISNGEGCPSNSFSTEVGLVSNNPDQPFIQYGGAICEGEQLVLSTIQLAGYQVNYEWTGPAGSTTSGAYPNSPYLILDNAKEEASGDYQVRITVDGCQTFTSPVQSVTVNTFPSFSVYNDGRECTEPTVDIQLFAFTDKSVEGLTFEWVGPNGFFARSQNPYLPNATDEYAGTYTVTVRNESGCEKTISTTVDISRIPHQPLIETKGDICSGTILTLSTTPYWGASVRYEWTGPAGTTTSGAYPNAPELTLTPATDNLNGNYSLVVIVDGCSSLASEAFSIEIAAPPVVTITNGGIDCAAPTSTLQLTTTIQGGVGPYNFEWVGPNGFTSTAANPVLANLSPLDAGTYTVLVTDASGCRSQVASQFIAINTPPTTPELEIVTPIICEGETAIFSANTYNGTSIFYHWALQGDTTKIYTTTSPSLILEDVPAWKSGFISLRVEVDGCTSANSGEMQFIVHGHPPTPSLASSFILCEGESLQLFTNTIADGYRWTGPNGFTSSQQYPTSITDIEISQSGIYTLTSIINGCTSDPVSTNVIVRGSPTQPVLQTATDICEGEDIVLQVLNPQAGLTYQWLSPSVMSQQFPDSQHLMVDTVLWTTLPYTTISKAAYPHLYEAGEWSVRVVNYTSCSSSTSLPRSVAIHELPSLPLMSNSGPICEGEPVQLLAGGMTDVIYSWYKEIPLTDTTSTFKLVSNSQNFEVNDLATGRHRYYLQVERNGCATTSMPPSSIIRTGADNGGSFTEVIVKGIPALTLPSSSGSYCTGQDIDLDAPTIAGATYAWTGPNGFVSFVEDPTIINSTSASSGVYRLVVTLDGCTSKEVSTQIVVGDQPPTPSIAYDGPTCEGEEIRLTVPNMVDAANVDYVWTGPNGLITTNSTLLHTNAQTVFAGDYTVRVIVNGCISQPSTPMPVVVNALPTAPTIGTNGAIETPLCEGEAILLETDYRPNTQYSWVGPAGFTSNLSNPIINNGQVINSGTYSLSIVENGCTSPVSTVEVGIHTAPSQPYAANTGPACAGTSFNLYIQNPVNGYRYEWYKQDGNEFVGEGSTLTLDNVDIRDAGVYYAIASVGNCSSDVFTGTGLAAEVVTEVVIENPAKELAHTEGNVFACDEEATISAIPPQFSTGFWTSATANSPARIIEPSNPTSLVTNLQTGQNIFVWSLESGDCGVTSTDTLIVEYNIPPTAADDFFSINLNEPQDLNLIANDQIQSDDTNIYILTDLRLGRVVRNGEGIYTYIPHENAVGVETFRYQICHTECSDLCSEATATVVVGEGIECFAAEFVTPNNDGFNDTFTVPCLANHPGSSLTIYNRYGDEIYFNDNYQNDWDGTYNGNPLPAGTYYYILSINDAAGTQLSGYIFLQR